jgi:hypothetical protein
VASNAEDAFQCCAGRWKHYKPWGYSQPTRWSG